MSWKIKIWPEDTLFSRFIRKRDKECVKCHSPVEFNAKGEPVSHQASHYWGRANWGTRFDPENVDTLCAGCHRVWGGDERRQYEAFKKKQLGERGYLILEIRKNAYARKDHKLALLYVQGLLRSSAIEKKINSYTGDVISSRCTNCGMVADYDLEEAHICSVLLIK